MASKLHLLVITEQEQDNYFHCYLGPVALTSNEVKQLQQEFDQYNLFANQLIRGQAPSGCYTSITLHHDLWTKTYNIKAFNSTSHSIQQLDRLKALKFTILSQTDSIYDKLLYKQSDITVDEFVKILINPFDVYFGRSSLGYGLLPTTMTVVDRLNK